MGSADVDTLLDHDAGPDGAMRFPFALTYHLPPITDSERLTLRAAAASSDSDFRTALGTVYGAYSLGTAAQALWDTANDLGDATGRPSGHIRKQWRRVFLGSPPSTYPAAP